MSDYISTLEFIPENLRDYPLYVEICDILDHIIEERRDEAASIIDKYRNPANLDAETIRTIIAEFGFGYIADVVSALSQEDLSNLLTFIGALGLFKGHRRGLELVIELLKIDFEIEEWWEQTPRARPETFSLVIDINESQDVPDFWDQLQRLLAFIRQYIYPIMDPLTILWSAIVSKRDWVIGGFPDFAYDGEVYSITGLWLINGFVDNSVSGMISATVSPTP